MNRLFITLIIIGTTFLTNAQTEISINTEESVINWKGSMLFSFNEHTGTVNFKAEKLLFEDNKIVSGDFTIDMNTIANTDGEYNEDLVGHLKHDDFFDVENFPESTLKFTSVEYHNEKHIRVIADLTIKGITNPIEFDAIVDNENKSMTVKLILDRTKWNIMYNSKSVIKIKDHALSDAIEYNVKIIY